MRNTEVPSGRDYLDLFSVCRIMLDHQIVSICNDPGFVLLLRIIGLRLFKCTGGNVTTFLIASLIKCLEVALSYYLTTLL